ncbi:MAG: hypothetical protein ABF508_08970 [Zymomonas mobilis]|uniref:hypothetical protein n=1 Tax=Zymomonas mobilis TaxID=542 RepID=UPI0039EADFE9
MTDNSSLIPNLGDIAGDGDLFFKCPLSIAPDHVTIPADLVDDYRKQLKAFTFNRSDGKSGHKIRLQMQNIDINVELIDDEVLNLSRLLSDAVTAIIDTDPERFLSAW